MFTSLVRRCVGLISLGAAAPLIAGTSAVTITPFGKLGDGREAALYSLTTANGGILRVSDTAVEMVIAPEATVGLGPGSVVVDVVRTDLIPPRHLSFFLEIPVVLPVTRGLT